MEYGRQQIVRTALALMSVGLVGYLASPWASFHESRTGVATISTPHDATIISIPRIALRMSTHEGRNANAAADPVHWHGTATPGQPGNAVFSGECGASVDVFQAIQLLRHGDEVVFIRARRSWTYRVTDSFSVADIARITQPSSSPTFTLSCEAADRPGWWHVVVGELVGPQASSG